jgi:hypothetical protein
MAAPKSSHSVPDADVSQATPVQKPEPTKSNQPKGQSIEEKKAALKKADARWASENSDNLKPGNHRFEIREARDEIG